MLVTCGGGRITNLLVSIGSELAMVRLTAELLKWCTVSPQPISKVLVKYFRYFIFTSLVALFIYYPFISNDILINKPFRLIKSILE